MKKIGIADLKDALSAHLRLVEAGETVEVTDRGRAIARIIPAGAVPRVAIQPAKRPFAAIRDRTYPPLNASMRSDALLRRDRAERLLPELDG